MTKTYTFQVGSGSGRELEMLVHSETYAASDFLDAIAHARLLMIARPPNLTENTVRILEVGSSLMWTPSVKFLRRDQESGSALAFSAPNPTASAAPLRWPVL